jgi:hypothetical protein
MQTRTYTRTCFFWTYSGRNFGQDGGCYLALDSVTHQASCQATFLSHMDMTSSGSDPDLGHSVVH